MTLFCCDLDNTLIYSYKHDIGEDKIPVERYQDRDISYTTPKTMEYLQKILEKTLFVPTTTRSLTQYERIQLPIPQPQYALVANGGILLKNGVIDEDWLEESKKFIEIAIPTLEQGMKLLENDPHRSFDLRWVDDLFVFTKSDNPDATILHLQEQLDLSLVDVHQNGAKVYIVPKSIQKGATVKRLKEKFNATSLICAGDSLFDVPMLLESDVAFAPFSLGKEYSTPTSWCISEEHHLFSEYFLEKLLSHLKIS